MMMLLRKIIIVTALCVVSAQAGDMRSSWVYIDFDCSMKKNEFPDALRITTRVVGIEGRALYDHFKSLFEKNNLSKIQPQKEPKIPLIIHQVWIGGKVPEEFKEYMRSWVMNHFEGWEYKLWTDEEVAKIKLYNQNYYDLSDNPGVKSDILKWEIVYRYGGVYIDTDFECLQPLDIFHYTYDFYTGIQPFDTQFLQLGAALFGAVPGHPILKHCVETIKDDWHHKGAPTKTGPLHFTKSFFAVAGKDGLIDIAMPAHYFYPLGCCQTTLKKSEWIQEGAYAVHHWAKSWMPAHFRQQKFKSINNEAGAKSWND
jgi:mannosyltransferase OCH1-like enzyme